MAHFDTSGLDGAAAQLAADGIDVVRLGYSDIIGTDRGRDVLVNRFARTVGGGVAFCRSVYGTTPGGDVVDFEGGLSAGLPDILAFPVLETMTRIPWEPGVAHCIADVFNPDGSPSDESPRQVLKRVIDKFKEQDLTPICGPELEFYLLEKNEAAPNGWARYGESSGNVYVSGLRGDPENVLLSTLRVLGDYGIEVVAANHEFSSGQFEINLWHSEALDAADRAHRFKAAIKELARSRGKLATFMAKPRKTASVAEAWYVGIWMEIQTSDVVDMDAADASIPYFTTDSWKVIGPDGFTENDTEGNAKLCADDSTTLVTQLEGQQKVRGLVVLDTKYRSGHLVLVQDYLDGGWEWDF